MNGVEISIIVPVYNVEKYIERCLESLINQTFKNIEIILINDGSTDYSKEICERYAKEDERIILINQQNKGQSAARNKGIEIARGNYIGFVDSDDYIEPNMYEVLYEKLNCENADCVVAQVNMVNTKGEILSNKINKNKIGNIETGKEAIIRYLENGRWSLWDKLYKAKFIKNIKFEEGRSCGEDHLGIIPILHEMKKIVTIDNYLYKYLVRENSTTTSSFSIKSFDNSYVWEEVLKYAKDNNLAEYIQLIDVRRFYSYIDLINGYLRVNTSEYQNEITEIIEKVKVYDKEFYKNNEVLKRYKVAQKLIKRSFKLYKFIFRRCLKC